jgi:CubicO group peptidase (beta-lactamase class C family)
MKHKILLSISVYLTFCSLLAQTKYSKEIESQIKQFENSLSGRVIINGKPDNILDRMAFYKVKGLSIAVIENYKVIWAKGYGWADEMEKRPITTSTLFIPGSISKTFNAMGVLKLAQDKKLDLNTDINTYLKSWKFPYDSVSKGKKITLMHLLSHSAGLSFLGSNGYSKTSKIPTLQQILDGQPPSSSLSIRSEFEPGLYHQYSNGGIVITQLMVTAITQQPYEKFMYENVLKPLGMTNSFFNQPPPSNKLKLIATGYDEDGTELATKFNIIPEQAAGGLWTTPTDVGKFIIETQLAMEGKSAKVLSSEMTKLQLTPTVDAVSALGVFIDKRKNTRYFTHDARNYGYCGVYYGSMEGGNGVVIFANSYNVGLLPEIANSIASVYKWKDFYTPVYKNEISVSESILKKYVGVYLYEGKLASVFKKQDGYYYYADGIASKMHFSSELDFFNQEFPSEKTFIIDQLGNITGYARKLNGVERPPANKVLRVDTLKANQGELNSIGWHLLETKKFAEAILYLKRAIELEPNNHVALNNLAHGYLFKNEYDKAIELYQQFINRNPNDQVGQKEIIKNDFVYFQKIGFDKMLISKALTALKL